MPTMQEALADAGLIPEPPRPQPTPSPSRPQPKPRPTIRLTRSPHGRTCHQCRLVATVRIQPSHGPVVDACGEHAADVRRLARRIGATVTDLRLPTSPPGTYDPYGSNPLPSVRHVRASQRR